ncbi:hypothetical protein CAI21_06585 [Alkalilimnicola ehrlichii]|nr:hypothetical protein CAI21_06585 [Alkalilimnicola ehrlichii]
MARSGYPGRHRHPFRCTGFGPIDQFPYGEGQGTFDVRAQVENGRLSYMPDWPVAEGLDAELRFHNRTMVIDARAGRIYGARAERVRAAIDDLTQARLELQGRMRGPGDDMLRFLADSPIGAGIRHQLDMFRVDGEHTLNLRVDVPFQEGPVGVSGSVELDRGVLRMPQWDLAIDDVRGTIDFTEKSLSAERLTGRLRGQDVIARATTTGADENASILVRADFNGALPGLLQRPDLEPLFRGSADWRFRLRLPALQREPGAVSISISSRSWRGWRWSCRSLSQSKLMSFACFACTRASTKTGRRRCECATPISCGRCFNLRLRAAVFPMRRFV